MTKSIKRTMGTVISMLGLFTVCTIGMVNYHITTVNELKELHMQHETKLELEVKDMKVYKELHEDTNKQLVETKSKLDEVTKENEFIKREVVLSKKADERFTKTNFANKPLTEYPIYSVEEMNNWIADRAPVNSTFLGKGKEFLEVAKEVDLDPRYLVAHAALESSWGTSRIAKEKNNYYGIGAYNATPYESAYTFSSAKQGIKEGAVWIKENYINKGQDTLNKMQYGSKTYCTLDDGKTPDQNWINKIVQIATKN